MTLDSTLAESIASSAHGIHYDASCKRLFSEKSILAWILKTCAVEFCELEPTEIAARCIEGEPEVGETPVFPDQNKPRIHGVSNEDVTMGEGTVSYDIRFFAKAPVSQGMVELIVNIETQNDYHPGYPLTKRAVYYCSRMISAQYGTEFTNSRYGQIKKVYSIWICPRPAKANENTIARFGFAQSNIYGSPAFQNQDYDLINFIMIGLGNEDKTQGLLRLLGVLLSETKSKENKLETLDREFHIPVTTALEKEVDTMCNLSKGIAEDGIKKGRMQGRAEGRAEGKVEGKAEGRAAAVTALMKNMKLSAQEAMEILEIPLGEREAVLTLIQQ